MAVGLAATAVHAEAEEIRSAVVTESDGKIATEIEKRFGRDPNVNASVVTISVRRGVVTLNGRVLNDDAKRSAGRVAGDVRGVTDVTNGLSVGAGSRGRPGGPGSIPEAVPGSE